MTSETYRCVCHTCDESEGIDELESAQAYFNEHADRGCEVVLRNVASTAAPATNAPPSPDSETASDDV